MVAKVPGTDRLSQMSTSELKNELLSLTKGRDTESLNQKALFYKSDLSPFFEELSRRNPFPTAEDQVPIILGVWAPIWSTIPFQDILPGRIREQSYQIFHDNGYYANIARYAPGHQRSFLQKLSGLLLAYDFMLIQKFGVHNGQWDIQNVGIEQGFRSRGIPLDSDKAEKWFTEIVESRLQGSSSQIASRQADQLKKLDKNTVKKVEKVFRAIPQLEHLYIDDEFRLVKTQREVKQRPSYTIAVRIR